MATATKKAPKRVKKGLKFHSYYADGNPEWEVQKSRGRGAWECAIVEDDLDYGGVTKLFDSKEILASVASAQNFSDMKDDHASFYASLTLGQIVHYHNGFGQFVRCEAVKVEGKMKLRSIAMVGDWRSHDLPKRSADGSIYWGFYPAKIRSGDDFFEPNYGCIYESPAYTDRQHVDPRDLEPIDFEPPGLSYEEAHKAAQYRALERVQEMIHNNREMDPGDLLKRVRDHVTDIIDGMGL